MPFTVHDSWQTRPKLENQISKSSKAQETANSASAAFSGDDMRAMEICLEIILGECTPYLKAGGHMRSVSNITLSK